jgi:hypothetical protein
LARKRHVAAYVLAALATFAAAFIFAVVALTRTGVGVEQIGDYVLGQVNRSINGRLHVTAIRTTGGLLGGVSLDGVDVRDPHGTPLLEADSVILSYDWRTLLAGRYVFRRVDLYRPRFVLERLPGDTAWNFMTVLAGPHPSPPGTLGPLVVLGELSVHDGDVVVRMPWDSAVDGPPDTTRFLLQRTPAGVMRLLHFEHVQADVPRVLASSPYEPGQLVRIASLKTRGYVWRQPFELSDLRGTLTLRDSIVSFRFDPVMMPDSRASATGRVVMSTPYTQMDLEIQGSDLALADLQWVNPNLPRVGRASLNLRIQSQGRATLYLFRRLDVQAPGTRIQGRVGIVADDSPYFTQVDLTAAPLNVELLQDLIPGTMPFKGLKVGRLEIKN